MVGGGEVWTSRSVLLPSTLAYLCALSTPTSAYAFANLPSVWRFGFESHRPTRGMREAPPQQLIVPERQSCLANSCRRKRCMPHWESRSLHLEQQLCCCPLAPSRLLHYHALYEWLPRPHAPDGASVALLDRQSSGN
eukprot:scaffold102596_cov30-Tisochrysis_lutea.AAC.2